MCNTWTTWAQTTVQRQEAEPWLQKLPGNDASGGELEAIWTLSAPPDGSPCRLSMVSRRVPGLPRQQSRAIDRENRED